ncbi:ejaculatory bulb-specific protein 3-like [Anopheles bellator]|uniref:ejaculatory bulb-specific protein 3-like n=1 Tax=Anopheles bellator TaxID=139047 RepID=UPI002647A2BF|nr:ejaculatory bulb-specific protein 3-like [Anopheles bellator]
MVSHSIVFQFALISAVLLWTVRSQNYVTKYDNINLDEIFNSERLMNNYMNCLKNVGPCTPDGKVLKDNLPDALMSDCVKCSEKQRIGADEVIKFIIANRPDDFAILEKLYDPTGVYRRKYLRPDGTLLTENGDGENTFAASGDGANATEAHTTEHNLGPSQDHGHGDGHQFESEN